MPSTWASRCAAAERAITRRHLRPFLHLPGTALGDISWPSDRHPGPGEPWHYWWQAHLLDCLIDAQIRQPMFHRRTTIRRLLRGMWIANGAKWNNQFFDDMAWLALALQRYARIDELTQATCHPGLRRCEPRMARPMRRLTRFLHDGWDRNVQAMIWRYGDQFFNTPANGPAGIFLARANYTLVAQRIATFIQDRLTDNDGLVLDGWRPDGTLEDSRFTYCQGVAIGLNTELALRLNGVDAHVDQAARARQQVGVLVRAAATHLTTDGIIETGGSDDGGLFHGILIRYLAWTATHLPQVSSDDKQTVALAEELVLNAAEAAWATASTVGGQPVFSSDWHRPAVVPTPGGDQNGGRPAEADLSVQLSAWMTLEAAHHLTTFGRVTCQVSP